MRALWTTGVAAAAIASALALVPAASAQSPGAAGLGDPYFPLMGNGGYEVDHYDLNLAVRPKPDRVRAVATISATATQALSSFNLDYRGPKVTSLTVDGARASVARRGGEMTVTPAAPLASGAGFTVVVAYKGRPRPIGGIGWIKTHDGTTVFSEPNGSPGWFPCNDHPLDKASYPSPSPCRAAIARSRTGCSTPSSATAARRRSPGTSPSRWRRIWRR